MSNTYAPRWIAKMWQGKSGRDHLGLGSVSADQILPVLSPGINVLTFHPRYFSFYVFLLDEFWRRDDRPKSRNSWIAFYRPREFIFSLGANMCDQPEHDPNMRNIVGGQKTQPLSNQQLDSYDTTFPYIDSELGGYGLYYRSTMAELGVIYPGGRGFDYPVDLPTEDRGLSLSAAFREAVQDTEYYRRYFDYDQVAVPRHVIVEYARKACLCQSKLPSTPDNSLLVDVFLHGGNEQAAARRRATFRMLLDIAAQTQGYSLDEDVYRQLLYFQVANNGAQYVPMADLTETHQEWRLYQTREYYAFAINAMWYHLCDWGIIQHGDIRSVPLAGFWDYMLSALSFDQLAARLNLPSPNLSPDLPFQHLLDWLCRVIDADATNFDVNCTIYSPINEHRLYRLALENREAPDVMIAGMLTLLGLIILRFGHSEQWCQEAWFISRMGADGRLSVNQFLRTIRRKLKEDVPTINDIAQWLYSDYVILQHQLVATSKLPDNTFRFRRDGQRLSFNRHENPLYFWNSHFDALRTTVHELGLCGDYSLPNHQLSQLGQQLLTEGDIV
jgi:hypothetical protein